ncbi:hypothetical protein B1964_17750 [Gordonia sp. i37]|nr:zf-HC2 domain-containing protein [Gordonia sp. i37]OPX13924.1 hypothetical protein B1964_17750 [Gordonia sp. i37]
MRCEVAREALSARVDGERETVPSARVDEHVAGCADCAQWYQALQRFTIPEIGEPLRVVRGNEGPDLVEMMIAAHADTAAPPTRGSESSSRTWWLMAGGAAFASGALAVSMVVTHGSVVTICLFVAAMLVTVGLTVRARR